ncbi:unnamed protein product [Lampetra fluviatilis]
MGAIVESRRHPRSPRSSPPPPRASSSSCLLLPGGGGRLHLHIGPRVRDDADDAICASSSCPAHGQHRATAETNPQQ